MIDAPTRLLVRQRAADRCEYCQRRQFDSPLIPLQMEHIVPLKHGGDDGLDNLALACADCNLRKSSDLAGLDPETLALTPLFHPRKDRWEDHFRWEGLRIQGITPIGRTTVQVLSMNSPARLRARRHLS